MSRPSQPPPGFRGPGEVAPVYGVPQPDGTIAAPRSVAEGAEALRARLAASAPLQGASSERRALAAAIDAAITYVVVSGVAAVRPLSLVGLIGLAVVTFFLIRVVVGTVTGGASPGRLAMGTRAVDEDGDRLDLLRLAGREGYVVFLIVTLPFWAVAVAWAGASTWSSETGASSSTGFSFSKAPVPQDATTGTLVATNAEIERVHAHAAALLQWVRDHPEAARSGASPIAAADRPPSLTRPSRPPSPPLYQQFAKAFVIAALLVFVVVSARPATFKLLVWLTGG